jgi:hypothetical protein
MGLTSASCSFACVANFCLKTSICWVCDCIFSRNETMTPAASESSAELVHEPGQHFNVLICPRFFFRKEDVPSEPRIASGSTAIARCIVSARHSTDQLLSQNQQIESLTVVILPEIDECPVKPHFSLVICKFFETRGGWWNRWGRDSQGILILLVELVWLYSLEARILAQPGHSGDKLIGSDARMQDRVEGSSDCGTRCKSSFKFFCDSDHH